MEKVEGEMESNNEEKATVAASSDVSPEAKSAEKPSKRPRHFFTKEQTRILEEAFQESRRLLKPRCNELMERTGVERRLSIVVWFNNRRCKEKKLALKRKERELSLFNNNKIGASPALELSPTDDAGDADTTPTPSRPVLATSTRTRIPKPLKFRYPRGPRKKNRTPPRMMPLPKIQDGPHAQGPPDISLPFASLRFMLTCKICKGYLYNATTLTECLHSFCKACLLKYVVRNLHCPTCKLLIHPSNPYLNIRVDHTVQDIVYKILPEVHKEDKKREEEFYTSRGLPYPPKLVQAPPTPPPMEEGLDSDDESDTSIDSDESDDDDFEPPNWTSVLLQFAGASEGLDSIQPMEKNFVRVPSDVTVGHIRKLVKMKLNMTYRRDAEVYMFVDTTLVHDSLSIDKVKELFFTDEEDELIIMQYGVLAGQRNLFEEGPTSLPSPTASDSYGSSEEDEEEQYIYEEDAFKCNYNFLTKTVEPEIDFPTIIPRVKKEIKQEVVEEEEDFFPFSQ